MLTIEQATQQLLAQAPQINEVEQVPLSDALNRILAEDIIAPINVPPADNSAMDGYAIHTDNLAHTATFPVSQTIAAGHVPESLKQGTAARILTGAEIPTGANTVIMQEQCTIDDDGEVTSVTVPADIKAGNNIRRLGQDIQEGNTVLQKQQALSPQALGLIASLGIPSVSVYRKLRVAILSSGDELLEPGQSPESGKIFNSNRFLLQGFLQQMGVDVMDTGSVKDSLEYTIESLEKAAEADAIICTGGVSVGDEDHIKPAVEQLGKLDFWRIAIKPGKPVAFGSIRCTEKNDTPFIGLPGNPASVFVTFLLFARPFLQTMQRQGVTLPEGVKKIAAFSRKANAKRQEFLRARLNNDGDVEVHPNQSSGVLSSTVWADGFAVLPIATPIQAGDTINFIRFKDFFLQE